MKACKISGPCGNTTCKQCGVVSAVLELYAESQRRNKIQCEIIQQLTAVPIKISQLLPITQS